MTKDEALKLALEEISGALPAYINGVASREHLAVIHEALAQPECHVATSDTSQERVDEMQKQRHDTTPQAKPWVNPSIKEYEDIMLANITPRTNDERDGIMGALSDMVVLLQEKNK